MKRGNNEGVKRREVVYDDDNVRWTSSHRMKLIEYTKNCLNSLTLSSHDVIQYSPYSKERKYH